MERKKRKILWSFYLICLPQGAVLLKDYQNGYSSTERTICGGKASKNDFINDVKLS